MTTGVREEVLQDTITWIVASTGATDTQVTPAFQDMPKPDKPFLLVTTLRHFDVQGRPERIRRRVNQEIEERVRVYAETEWQLDGYGIDTVPWMEDLRTYQWRSDIRQQLEDLHITPRPASSVNEVSTVLADTYERRVQQDWVVEYTAVSDWYQISSQLEEVHVNGHIKDTTGQALAQALDVDYTLTD